MKNLDGVPPAAAPTSRPLPWTSASLDRKNMDGSDIPERGNLHLGRVIAVSATQAVVLLETRDPAATSAGALPLEMGTLVKMHTRVSMAYGMVTGLRVPLPSLEPSDKDLKLIEIQLVGEIETTNGATGSFQRGI